MRNVNSGVIWRGKQREHLLLFNFSRLTGALVGNINRKISLVLLAKKKKLEDLFFMLISVFQELFHTRKVNIKNHGRNEHLLFVKGTVKILTSSSKT